jgi:hypothetical protein
MKSKALLIGLNYEHVLNENVLEGCINDVQNVSILLRKFGFAKENIIMITDENLDNAHQVTWTGIILELTKLCIASWKDDLDVVVFHYSGHGRQVKDWDGNEVDGLDEGLVPIDFKKYGIISDDVLNAIFREFNPKTRILCIFDCCHSGSILDLPYSYLDGHITQLEYTYEGPFILCMSAGRDGDVAGEVHKGKDTGAFTTYLIQELSALQEISVFDLQASINAHFVESGYDQLHVLSSSRKIDNALSVYKFLTNINL